LRTRPSSSNKRANPPDKLKNALGITVKGTVTDETGQAMPGINVKENGTQNGTVNDNKGTFSLAVTNNDAIITFSYIGYETKELTPTPTSERRCYNAQTCRK
jgi:hypothetical protein